MVRYNRRAELIRNSSAMSAVAVVTNSDGYPLNRGEAISIPTELSGLYFVGSLEDWMSGSLTQRVYAVKPCVVQELMAKNEAGGVPLLELESFLQERCTECIVSLCINDHKDRVRDGLLCEVFAGSSAPNTEGMTSFVFDRLGLTIHHALLPSRTMQSKTPLSMSFVDVCTHNKRITCLDVECTMKAYSTQGSSPNRQGSRGHSSYSGLRIEGEHVTVRTHPHRWAWDKKPI